MSVPYGQLAQVDQLGVVEIRAGDMPAGLTSYDFLKTFALLTMVVDHIGVYLFPDQVEWRIVGRLSLPVWMFLIGFARSRDINQALIAGAVIILMSNLVFGEHLLPVNILFTIIIARLLIDNIMRRALDSQSALWVETFVLAVLLAPTLMLFEYGTHAILFAMAGYLVRHRGEINLPDSTVFGFLILVSIIHALTQAYLLETDLWQSMMIVSGVVLLGVVLSAFRAREFLQLTRRLPRPISGALQLMGRHTLALYVLHLLLLKAVAAWWLWDRPWLLHWRWLLFGD